MALKKYVAAQVALKTNQKEALDAASAKMARHIGIELSRADVIERLCNLYNQSKLEEA
jgi:hypothetical protein